MLQAELDSLSRGSHQGARLHCYFNVTCGYLGTGVLIAVGVGIGLVNVGGGTPGSGAALGQQQGRLNTRYVDKPTGT